MLFRKRRLTKAALAMHSHLEKMADLEQLRDQYELEALGRKDRFGINRKGMALAVNYELVSHSSRALAALRKAEEIAEGGPAQLAEAEPIRQYLQSRADLPAMPRRLVGVAPDHEVERQFAAHLSCKTRLSDYFPD